MPPRAGLLLAAVGGLHLALGQPTNPECTGILALRSASGSVRGCVHSLAAPRWLQLPEAAAVRRQR